MYAAMRTERLAYLNRASPRTGGADAGRAQKVADFRVLTGGRMALHIIAGLSDEEQRSEGDFLLKQDRYRRGSEYLEIMRRTWTSDMPFDYSGTSTASAELFSDVKPYQRPYPPIFFGARPRARLRWARGTATCSRCSANRWPKRASA